MKSHRCREEMITRQLGVQPDSIQRVRSRFFRFGDISHDDRLPPQFGNSDSNLHEGLTRSNRLFIEGIGIPPRMSARSCREPCPQEVEGPTTALETAPVQGPPPRGPPVPNMWRDRPLLTRAIPRNRVDRRGPGRRSLPDRENSDHNYHDERFTRSPHT